MNISKQAAFPTVTISTGVNFYPFKNNEVIYYYWTLSTGSLDLLVVPTTLFVRVKVDAGMPTNSVGILLSSHVQMYPTFSGRTTNGCIRW